MKKIVLTSLGAMLLLSACNSSADSTCIDDLRDAEAAVALGDMEAAKSVASHIIGSGNMSRLPAKELARLSLIYMQIADSTDRESSIAQATDLYRQAYKTDPDSASAFYSDVNPDMYPYVTMLKTLVGHLENPYNPESENFDDSVAARLPEANDSI